MSYRFSLPVSNCGLVCSMKGFLFRGIALVFLPFCAVAMNPAEKGEPRWAGHHHAEAEFRARQLRDENGQIPADALLNALKQKQQMKFNPAAWPGTAGSGTSGGQGLRIAGIG